MVVGSKMMLNISFSNSWLLTLASMWFASYSGNAIFSKNRVILYSIFSSCVLIYLFPRWYLISEMCHNMPVSFTVRSHKKLLDDIQALLNTIHMARRAHGTVIQEILK